MSTEELKPEQPIGITDAPGSTEDPASDTERTPDEALATTPAGITYRELERPTPRRGIAPVWHTVLLVVAILVYSFWGAQRANLDASNALAPVSHATVDEAAKAAPDKGAVKTDRLRMIRYGLSGALELFVVGWVAIGLRLRKVQLRTLFGKLPRGLNDIFTEIAIAAGFWIGSMVVLVAVALTWTGVQTMVYQHQLKVQTQSQGKPGAPSNAPKPESPEKQQAEAIKQLMELAPANGIEIAAWGALCLIVGFSEELIFRGYLQAQGIALLRNVPISVVLTSLIFGTAHGYQGLRGMFMIAIFGALFSGITLLRRNLFPGMVAHAWHDFATGMMLALIRSTHLLDRLAKPS